uniref:Glutathione S-transferase 1 (Fragments) n=1 Tax=Populus euphratica TaxID=75702 RepID=GSTF1_POPEU|nr:RecName: Full=Glutathione S-transferase 1; AltName: Full=GST class-phi member 1 [Populus euphratica]
VLDIYEQKLGQTRVLDIYEQK